MKIRTTVTTTEIECDANELRQSNSLSDGFYNLFRGCFNNMTSDCSNTEDSEVSEDAQDRSEE